MKIKRILVKQSRFLGNCVCGVSVGIYRKALVRLLNLIKKFSIVYRLTLVINSNVPGWRVEPTAKEDGSLATYCEWTFILNKPYACNYYISEYFSYLFHEILLISYWGKYFSIYLFSMFS